MSENLSFDHSLFHYKCLEKLVCKGSFLNFVSLEVLYLRNSAVLSLIACGKNDSSMD